MSTKQEVTLKCSNRIAPRWKYCCPLVKRDTNTVVCNFVKKKIMNERITRAKEHLMGKKENVSACTNFPKEVRG